MYCFRLTKTPGLILIFAIVLVIQPIQAFPDTDPAAAPVASKSEKEDLAFIKNLFKDKIYRFARQEAQSFLQKYPDSPLTPHVIFIQAQMNVIEGRFELALRQYQRIVSQYPDSPVVEDALYFGGSLKLQLNMDKGLIDFDRLLVKFPKSEYLPQINFHKGELRFQEENWEVAERRFKSVLEAEKIDDRLRLKTQHYLAWIYYFTGETLLAKSLFFELLESEINDTDKAKIAFQLGIEAQKNNRYEKAISWFERQLTEWPLPEVSKRSEFRIAECYFLKYQNDPDSSTKEEKEKAIELYTGNLEDRSPVSPVESRYQRGKLLTALGRTAKAEEDFAWLQKNKPDYAADLELTALRARHFESSKQLQQANQVYINALEHQTDDEIRHMLLISIIRNADTLDDCQSVLKWQEKIDLTREDRPDRVELSYYAGRCHYEKKNWEKAAENFARIPLDSQYARPIFSKYLDLFKRMGQFQQGMAYLKQIESETDFVDKDKMLLLKMDLCLTLEQWALAIDYMLSAKEEIPDMAADAWFLLNIAKTADEVYYAYVKKTHPIHRYPLKSRKWYANLSLEHYQAAYTQLTDKERETKLSILDILIERHKALKNHEKVISLYNDAITYIDSKQRKAELRLLIASIYLYDLNQPEQAQSELHKIHNKGQSETYYQASSLLAELYVEEEKFIQAIKILEDLASQPITNTRWYSTTHFRLGELYQANERWQKALAHYDAVINGNQDPAFVDRSKQRAAEIRNYLKQHQ